MPKLDEFAIIERYFSREAAPRDVLIGIGDDAAVLDIDAPLAVTVDTLNVGIHFPADFPAHALGHRLLAVNLSDLAAMGATPRWCTLALTMPDAVPEWLDGFAAGLFGLADRHGVALVGGNLSRGPLSLTLQLMGTVARDQALQRSGGSVGDDIYVTGTPGDAAAGLAILQSDQPGSAGHAHTLVERFSYPTARVAAGRALTALAHAAIDISDGLLADLGHLAKSSACGALVDADALPLSAALLAECGRPRAVAYALSGGDDYELCFTAPPARAAQISAAMQRAETRVTRIGCLVAGTGVRVEDAGVASGSGGYRHF